MIDPKFYVKGFEMKGEAYVPFKSKLFDTRKEATDFMESIKPLFHDNGWKRYNFLEIHMETGKKII